ncbi:MAG: DUF3794 domain-containing protein [Negativicutes bacterium]|nr:DUF3794 domain-containing protein [Negativicutes bacterium]
MDDKDLRATGDPCTLGAQTGPIIVRQVIGEKMKQKVLDIHVVVPERKPAIEQIIDVFVKEVEVTNVEVITDKVIVRGEFEIKAIYVACLPNQPVHAVEIKHYKWTLDIDMPGARRGMDADASVMVEFVDYDVNDKTRAYKYKYGGHQHDDDCDDDNGEECPPCNEVAGETDECLREFDVSVVLKVTAKVMADREVTLGTGTLPVKPKG